MIEVVLLALLGVATLIYCYMSHSYNYWRRKGLPQPPIVFGFGNFLDTFLLKNSLGLVYNDIYNSYPDNDAVGMYGFYTPRLLIRSPDLIKRVVVSEFTCFHDNEISVLKRLDPHFAMDPFCQKGDEWKQSRAKLVSTMTATRIKEIFPLMKETISRLDDFINEHLCKDIEAKELATLFAMDNVSSTVFGITSNCFTDPEAAFRKMGDGVMKRQPWKTMVWFLMPKIRNLLGFRFIPVEVNDYVEKMVQDVFEYRVKNNMTRNDLFQYFMRKNTGNNFDEMFFYGITFFIEGYETSAMVASKALFELAVNPNVQQTLYEEIRGACSDQSDIDFDALNSLPYLDKVIQEVQRKYPIAYNMNRICTKPVTLEIDGKYVDIEPGTPVIIPAFSIQNDPRYFPNPEKFDPERFNEDNKSSRPQYTYIPFGEGPRICPGIRFALVQVKLFILNIVLKYKVLRTEKTPKKLTFSKHSFLVTPNEEQWIRFERRK